jgi:hypothetical protein
MGDITSQTIESADHTGNLGLFGESVTHHIRDGAGGILYLEVVMKALAEIRDLFKLGTEAEGFYRQRSHRFGRQLEAFEERARIEAALVKSARCQPTSVTSHKHFLLKRLRQQPVSVRPHRSGASASVRCFPRPLR